mgnify:CR=1 FL=1|tara:strand:+ start:669 stop:1136 length:468 start_codon:yes stop_codon:yes gene_type:complete
MKEIKNFISSEESNKLIQFHEKNFNLNNKYCFMHRNTAVMNHPMFTKFTNIAKALTKFIKNINNNYVINYFQIVKWPMEESQGPHLDFDYHPYTSIIYLNDDFEGGETVVLDKTILPEKNKLISFEGNRILHKVNKITKGIRYTVPCWYKYESIT